MMKEYRKKHQLRRKVINGLLIVSITFCVISLAWSTTYHFDPTGKTPNHCCVEMTDEVSELFNLLHVPHKKVTGMTRYSDEWDLMICHKWIMIETPIGEIPFECVNFVPIPLKEYYNYI